MSDIYYSQARVEIWTSLTVRVQIIILRFSLHPLYRCPDPSNQGHFTVRFMALN